MLCKNNIFKTWNLQDFTVVVTEEFLEYVQEDALSIEVWGHRSSGNDEMEEITVLENEIESSSLQNFTSGKT